MTTTTRAGLTAGLITALFAGCVAGSLILTSTSSERRGAGPSPATPPAPVPRAEGESGFDYALRHRWWKQAPTSATLNSILDAIVSCQRRDTVWVDDRGNATVTTSPADHNGRPILVPPDPKPPRCLHVYLGDATRPTREDALRKLVAALDVADYN